MPQLRFDMVGLTYEGLEGGREALRGLDLRVETGEPVSILGASGCGKSTMLLIAAGLLEPTVGEVSIDGVPVSGPRDETSLILQDFGLLPWKTVAKNAGLGLKIRHFTKHQIEERTAAALAQVGLSEYADSYPGELSGGMKQRLALARAVALDCDLLMMDEPLSALDALLREKLQNLLLQLHGDMGYTQLLVTHSIEEAVFLGRRIVLMSPHPGHVDRIIDNPAQGSIDYRGTREFAELCKELREALAAQDGANAAVPAGVVQGGGK